MSRKHFTALAAGIRRSVNWHRNGGGAMDDAQRACALNALRDAAEGVADACREANPRFDRVKFLTACGFGE